MGIILPEMTQWLRRLRYGRPVVIVAGLPRSGTSMVMQMLAVGGLKAGTDHVRAGDEDNPNGYLELERVKDLDKGGDKSWVADYRGQAIKVVSSLLRELPADGTYRVVFLERDLDEVLRSQRAMLERRGESAGNTDDGLKESFAAHLRQVRLFLTRSPSFETLYVEHRQIINHPAAAAGRINAFLGGELDERSMAAVVDPALYRNREPGN